MRWPEIWLVGGGILGWIGATISTCTSYWMLVSNDIFRNEKGGQWLVWYVGSWQAKAGVGQRSVTGFPVPRYSWPSHGSTSWVMPHLPQMPSPNVHESEHTVEESASTVHVVGARGQIGLFLWPAVLLLPGMAPHIFSLPSFALGRHQTYYPSNNFGIGRGFWTFSFILVDEPTTWRCVIFFQNKTVSLIKSKLPFIFCMASKG